MGKVTIKMLVLMFFNTNLNIFYITSGFLNIIWPTINDNDITFPKTFKLIVLSVHNLADTSTSLNNTGYLEFSI